jgi:hypothetical protein
MTAELAKDYKADMDLILSAGKKELEAQKVVINRDTFNDVLDTIHNNFLVKMPERVQPSAGISLLQRFADMSPEPFNGWRSIMSQTLERIQRLPAKGSEIDIAEAYGPLSDHFTAVIEEVQRRINTRSATTLSDIFKQGTSSVVETFRSYFLIPFQRLSVKFHTDTLRVPPSYKLESATTQDLHAILDRHFDYMEGLKKTVTGYTKPKLAWARDRLAQVLKELQSTIRAPFFPGGPLGSSYFVGSLLGGILAEFINPNSIPSMEGVAIGGSGTLDTSSRGPLQIIDACLNRVRVEGLNFSEQQIKEIIARKNESEKLVFIGRFEKLTPEEKKVELMKKRLGLGEWSVGGTKVVYAYNPEQYEREREQKIQMGLGDFLPPETNALLYDDEYGGGGEGAEGGYDNVQTTEDNF